MTTVYLAFSSTASETLRRHVNDAPVDLLVSYLELRTFERKRAGFNVRRWCLDSGAFSAHNSGVRIDNAEFIAAAKDCDAAEVFGLDVIGDADATRRNLEAAWSSGVAAIPTFHAGEPWSALVWCCSHAPKIALGGVAGRVHESKRLRFAQACFARCWPKRVHGFGMASRKLIEALPFESVDSSSWAVAPSAMGAWAGYTGTQIGLRSRGIRDFWIEVEEHRKRATWAAYRWRKELASLHGKEATA